MCRKEEITRKHSSIKYFLYPAAQWWQSIMLDSTVPVRPNRERFIFWGLGAYAIIKLIDKLAYNPSGAYLFIESK